MVQIADSAHEFPIRPEGLDVFGETEKGTDLFSTRIDQCAAGCAMAYAASYGIISPMSAELIIRQKFRHGQGAVEIVVWSVPKPVPPAEHPFKYRLVYVVDGARVVGYDNEPGKGDHKHLGEQEQPYQFRNVQTLLADFWRDLEHFK